VHTWLVDATVGEEEWQPLLRPSFLEALWQKLADLWQELGFQPEEGSTHPGTALLQYAQNGFYAQQPLTNSGQHSDQKPGLCSLLPLTYYGVMA